MAVHSGGRGPGHLSRAGAPEIITRMQRLMSGAGESAMWLPTGYSDLYAESARTTPVTAGSGSAVGAVDDYAGNGNHLIQATTGDRPTATTGLAMNGSGQCMYRTFTPSSSMTIVMGVKTTDTSLMLLSDSAGGAGFLGVAQVNVATDLGVGDTWIDGVQFVDGVNTRTEVLTALNDGAWHIVEFRNVNLSTWGGLGFFEQFSTGFYSYAGACSGIVAIDVADLGAGNGEVARLMANALIGSINDGA